MEIGIVGYGGYIPRFRISVDEIARVWGENAVDIKKGLLVEEKSVPDIDEDTITISVEAGKNALSKARIDRKKIGALYIGSESHPYIVKPSGTVVAEALGLSKEIMIADFEFACKAGTAAMQCCYGLVKAREIEYGMAIGADTAQGRPGDALEYTAAAGAAAFIIGNNPLASIEGTYSFTTDTTDFWRREGEDYPKHGARFTGKPAYFRHVLAATRGLMEKLSLKPSDFNYVVFHMPNGKFPIKAAKILGFSMDQLKTSLIIKYIGNSYSASSPLGLCAVMDKAKPGDRILLTSYGSGAGSDSFSLVVTEKILECECTPKIEDYIKNKVNIDYGMYVRLRSKLRI
jgi:hydroxymethylglutaryl-CoA synthase